MTAFATLPPDASPLRFVLVGAGGRAPAWIQAVRSCRDAVLVGIVDIDLASAEAVRAEAGLDDVAVGESLAAIASATEAQAVINATVPKAHLPVSVEALFRGLPVLCEKPLAPSVREGLLLVAAAEASRQLLAVSQTRRYVHTLAALKALVRPLGDVGLLTTEFSMAPHFGGYREEMDHVLLLDMAIHAFDVARYLLDSDPVAVYCNEWNPRWSWYAAGAAASAIFEFDGGARYVYTGSWCSDGFETSWNGRWRVGCARGTALWDGEAAPRVDVMAADAPSGVVGHQALGVSAEPSEAFGCGLEGADASLAEFIGALRTGVTPSCEVHSNILSLAMVEAAVRSTESRERITIRQILTDAHADALERERNPGIRARLEAWPDPAAALGAPMTTPLAFIETARQSCEGQSGATGREPT